MSLAILFVCNVSAVEKADHARVTVEGNILDTPCSIDPGSRDQTISMGATPVGVLAHSGAGRRVPFSIRLTDCTLDRLDDRLPAWRGVSVIFSGATDGSDFAVSGTAKGVSLRLFDADGNRALPGKALPDQQLLQSDQSLDFSLQLVANHRALEKGDYQAVIHFGLSYF